MRVAIQCGFAILITGQALTPGHNNKVDNMNKINKIDQVQVHSYTADDVTKTLKTTDDQGRHVKELINDKERTNYIVEKNTWGQDNTKSEG